MKTNACQIEYYIVQFNAHLSDTRVMIKNIDIIALVTFYWGKLTRNKKANKCSLMISLNGI